MAINNRIDAILLIDDNRSYIHNSIYCQIWKGSTVQWYISRPSRVPSGYGRAAKNQSDMDRATRDTSTCNTRTEATAHMCTKRHHERQQHERHSEACSSTSDSRRIERTCAARRHTRFSEFTVSTACEAGRVTGFKAKWLADGRRYSPEHTEVAAHSAQGGRAMGRASTPMS